MKNMFMCCMKPSTSLTVHSPPDPLQPKGEPPRHPPPSPPQPRHGPARHTPPPSPPQSRPETSRHHPLSPPQSRPEPSRHHHSPSSPQPRLARSPLTQSPARQKPELSITPLYLLQPQWEQARTPPSSPPPPKLPENARTPPGSPLHPNQAPVRYSIPIPRQPKPEQFRPGLIIFSLKEIQSATQEWNSNRVLGSGRTGTVFRGKLKNEQTVAIKRLHKDSNIEEQFSKEYKAEKVFLREVRHDNIIELIGFASKEKELILVLELVPKGTLYDRLHDRRNFLKWEIRMKIALGAARAMDCIHQAIPGPILHRDIRTTNILLDQKYNAKLIDFGSATYQPPRLQCNFIVGSEPYIAPEYQKGNKLSTKCDIYSFGVVLLELITGRQPARKEEVRITEWASLTLVGTDWDVIVPRMIDERIRETVPLVDMKKMMKLATDCIRDDFSERPNSRQVVARLLEISCLARIGRSTPF